jgi:hypothetical protein
MENAARGSLTATIKSFAVSIAPMVSIPQRYGVPSLSSPAMTGEQKYGPNLPRRIGKNVSATNKPQKSWARHN